MPTYQYACTACGEQLEAVQSFSDASLTICPACGGTLRKVFSAVGVVFKGSGFYKTDSRASAKDAAPKPVGDKADKGGGDKGGGDKGGGDKGGGAQGGGDKGGADKGSGDKSGGKKADAPAKTGTPAATSSTPAAASTTR